MIIQNKRDQKVIIKGNKILYKEIKEKWSYLTQWGKQKDKKSALIIQLNK